MKFWSLFILFANAGFAMSWPELLELHKPSEMLMSQYRAFAEQRAPAIADVKWIPIDENNEGLIDLRTISSDWVQMMPDPAFPFEGPWVNSGYESASRMREEVFRKLVGMAEELRELAGEFGYQPGQVTIRVFEGLRDLSTQKKLYDRKREEILAAHPGMTFEEAEAETSKWVSPYKNNVPVHSTGAAVDVRLWDNEKGDFLDLGNFGVIWGGTSVAPTFCEEITDEQKHNRLYCLMAADHAGLTNYVYEFWHFSSGDRYAAYWTGGTACYGGL